MPFHIAILFVFGVDPACENRPTTYNRFEFESVIGKGSFGQVWKGKWRQTQIAIKQIKQEIIDQKSKI